jgi:hypothetical protein
MKWRYRALAIPIAFNLVVLLSIFALGYLTVWILIPGAYVAFWLCNLVDSGCKGYDNAPWVVGALVNAVLGWGPIWAMGARRRV